MANRLTQIAEEVLETGASPNARITQVSLEVLETGTHPKARFTQVSEEVLIRWRLVAASQPIIFVAT